MHHEKDVLQEAMAAILRKQAQEMGLGPTGEYPGGKLTSTDEGEIAFAVGALDGKVIVNFGSPVASLGLSVEQAYGLAHSLRVWANRIKRGRV